MIELIVSLMPLGDTIFKPLEMMLRFLGELFSKLF